MPSRPMNPLLILHKRSPFNAAHLLILERLATGKKRILPDFELLKHMLNNHPGIRKKVAAIPANEFSRVARETLNAFGTSGLVTPTELREIACDAEFRFNDELFERLVEPHLNRLVEQGLVVENNYHMFSLNKKITKESVAGLLRHCRVH